VASEREGFWLRITGKGDWHYEGADLGILITRGRLMTRTFRLNERARQWIAGIRGHYSAKPLAELEAEARALETPAAGAFKIL
jgi:hypothetical protein